MGGKKPSHGPTREGQRFHWLIHQLKDDGIDGAQLHRLTGINQAHISAFKNIEGSGKSGIGAEIVRKLKEGLGLDPDYFYDDYEGQRPYKVYLLKNRREEKRDVEVDELKRRMGILEALLTDKLGPRPLRK